MDKHWILFCWNKLESSGSRCLQDINIIIVLLIFIAGGHHFLMLFFTALEFVSICFELHLLLHSVLSRFIYFFFVSQIHLLIYFIVDICLSLTHLHSNLLEFFAVLLGQPTNNRWLPFLTSDFIWLFFALVFSQLFTSFHLVFRMPEERKKCRKIAILFRVETEMPSSIP